MDKICEIASELQRLAKEITWINERPFGGRIDIRKLESGTQTTGDSDDTSDDAKRMAG